MAYFPVPQPPFPHLMVFNHWTKLQDFLYLAVNYQYNQWNGPSMGWTSAYTRPYTFSAYAPTVTAPIDFEAMSFAQIDSAFTPISNQSVAAVAKIIFDPDNPGVTWGGPLITLRITIPDYYAQFEFSVQLPAYTDPISLDGRFLT